MKEEEDNKMPENVIVREKFNTDYIDRDVIRLSNDFIEDFFLSEETSLELSINCYKIIFEIMKIIHNEQFKLEENKRKGQLRLFEDDFLTENNTYLLIKIRNSKITRDTKLLEEAYEKLVKYKQKWYKATNSKGKKIKTFGGLISNVNYEDFERGYTRFLVSSYWLQKMLDLANKGYNNFLAGIINETNSSKNIFTAIWLTHRAVDSERLTVRYLNETFGVNCKTARDFCNKFLKLRKSFLDKNALTSFNYKADGAGHVIIERYKNKTLNQEGLITPESTNEQQIKTYIASYYKKRHKLTDEQHALIKRELKNRPENKELLTEAYNRLVTFTKLGCNGEYKLMTDYVGVKFILHFQQFINALCQEKGIPKELYPNFGKK